MSVGSRAGVRSFAKSALKTTAIGVSALALQATGAWAQSADTLSGVTVEADQLELESPKYTAPLLDTPQTVTVVPAEVIQQQNLLNLRDVLSTLPGITFGAGEGGGGYGDSINVRGYSANNDIAVDGVRDSAQYSRTDPFNLEQIELSNGANSVYAGAGSVGGSINLVSKRPHGTNRSVVSVSAGTDAYGRITADVDQAVNDGTAFRVNVMMHQNDVPGRDVDEYQRFGIAPSITFGRGGDTQLTLSYLHQQDDNTPQYGVPFALNAFNDGAFPGVDPSDYYGYSNIDSQETQVDVLTAIVDHRFHENLSLRNLTRYQDVKQDLISSAPQGTFCLQSGINPFTGAACGSANTYAPSGPRGNVRNSENVLYYNQTDLMAEFDTGGVEHTMVAGLALTHEEYDLVNGNLLRNANGATPNPSIPTLTLINPNSVWTGPVNFIVGGGALANAPGGTCNTTTLAACVAPAGGSEGERENIALYVFDTAELSPNWELTGGVRVERNEGRNRTHYYTTYGFLPSGDANVLGTQNGVAPAGVLNGHSAWGESEDTLVSYRVGVVYKPVENASFYIAYGNSETPSQATVNGGCTIDGGTNGASNCNVDPEEAVNYEIGAKYDAFDGQLQLTAAIFRNERSNFRVNSGDASIPQQQLDGSSRVDGLALGATGLLTDNWSIFANYTYLDSEILQNISDIAIGGGTIDFQAGDPLPTTPEHSASLWTTYDFGNGIMAGYGATYQGEYTFNRFSSSAPLFYTDDYVVQRAMIAWEATDNMVLQLNVNNLTDELYYERVRNNSTSGWATPGAARSFVLSANMRF
jgi:catecholate siderophore receptor